MSTTCQKFLILVLLSLIAFVLKIELFPSRKINPVALTRHAIKQCERVENEALLGISQGSLPTDLKAAIGLVAMHSKTFHEGYIKLSDGSQPNVLDAWKHPLQMMTRSNLHTLPNASLVLLSKTNEIIIWSSGPNGSNEFGNGDDIVLAPPPADK